jgi:membrane-associated phospholipid phosphatase
MNFFSKVLIQTFLFFIIAHQTQTYSDLYYDHSFGWKVNRAFAEIVYDALLLQVNLFTVTSAKILTAITPFYLTTRIIDEPMQCKFYDANNHKNINQLPKACHSIGKNVIGVPMVVLSSLAFFAPTEGLRETARMFIIGLPFVHWGKDLIKTCDAKICLRPWHEDFDRKKRSTGGFPSGHMANVTYMTALFGIRHGAKFAVPLGLLATFIFADFFNCNRHYLSQLVAGAGLGLLYAFAANRVIEKKIAQRMRVCLDVDARGRANITAACDF